MSSPPPSLARDVDMVKIEHDNILDGSCGRNIDTIFDEISETSSVTVSTDAVVNYYQLPWQR